MCKHPNREVVTSGGIEYVSGDIVDTLKDEEFCTDCGEVIEEEMEDIVERNKEFEEGLIY